MGQSELVDCDKAEAAWRERIAQMFDHASGNSGRPPCLLGQDQVADIGISGIRHRNVSPFALVDGLEPEPVAFAVKHPQDQLCTARQLLHWMRDQPASRLLGAGENAIAYRKRAALAPLDHPQLGWHPFAMPAFRNGERLTII